jgi:hypothetical protein
VLLDGVPEFLTGVILVRTAVTVGITLEFAALVYPGAAVLHRVTNRLPTLILFGVLLTGVISASPTLAAYRRARVAEEPLGPIIETLSPNAPALTTQPTVAERLLPFTPSGAVLVLPNHQGHAMTDIDTWLADTLVSYDHILLLEDLTSPAHHNLSDTIRSWLAPRSCIASQTWYGPIWAERYVLHPAQDEPDVAVEFSHGLHLLAAAPPATLAEDGAFCLTLTWLPTEALPADYTIFVHVTNQDGHLIAQSDLAPTPSTAAWQPEQIIQTTQGVALPGTLASGTYTIQVGLYTPGDGVRLPLESGDNSLTLVEIELDGGSR